MNRVPSTRRQFVASSIAATSAAGLLAAQDERPKIIDAWGHVSLPRFLSAEEFLAILDASGAEAAIVGTAATCPDLRELSRAAVQYGDRLRSIGMPMGRSAQERSDCITAQMECGFTGIRLTADLGARRTSSNGSSGRNHDFEPARLHSAQNVCRRRFRGPRHHGSRRPTA